MHLADVLGGQAEKLTTVLVAAGIDVPQFYTKYYPPPRSAGRALTELAPKGCTCVFWPTATLMTSS
jgi:hypothetical protein